MSYAMKAARRRGQMGDPGLFGFIGSAIKTVGGVVGSVLPGPAGTIVKGISNALPGKNFLAPRAPSGPGLQLPTGTMPTISFPGTGGSAMPGTGFGVPVPSGSVPVDTSGGGMIACKPGYRMNKSKYFTERDIFGVKTGGITIHNPGTKCVKSRRMNPLNPRAISRAIRRLESAKRATSRLSRVSIRGGCGCK